MMAELKMGEAVAACTRKKQAQCMTKSSSDIWCFHLELSMAGIGTLLNLHQSTVVGSCGARDCTDRDLGLSVGRIADLVPRVMVPDRLSSPVTCSTP